MAFAVTDLGDIASTGMSGAATATKTGVTVPAGAIILVHMSDSIGNAGTVTDSSGNTYSPIDRSNNIAIIYAPNVAALSAGSISYSTNAGSGSLRGNVVYITGAATSAPYDAATFASSSGVSAVPSVISGSPSTSNEFFMAYTGYANSGSTSFSEDTGNGWTTVSGISGPTGNQIAAISFKTGTGFSTQTHTPGTNTSGTWSTRIYAFKGPAAVRRKDLLIAFF